MITPAPYPPPLWTSGVEGHVDHMPGTLTLWLLSCLLIPFYLSFYFPACPVGNHSDMFDVQIRLFL